MNHTDKQIITATNEINRYCKTLAFSIGYLDQCVLGDTLEETYLLSNYVGWDSEEYVDEERRVINQTCSSYGYHSYVEDVFYQWRAAIEGVDDRDYISIATPADEIPGIISKMQEDMNILYRIKNRVLYISDKRGELVYNIVPHRVHTGWRKYVFWDGCPFHMLTTVDENKYFDIVFNNRTVAFNYTRSKTHIILSESRLQSHIDTLSQYISDNRVFLEGYDEFMERCSL